MKKMVWKVVSVDGKPVDGMEMPARVAKRSRRGTRVDELRRGPAPVVEARWKKPAGKPATKKQAAKKRLPVSRVQVQKQLEAELAEQVAKLTPEQRERLIRERPQRAASLAKRFGADAVYGDDEPIFGRGWREQHAEAKKTRHREQRQSGGAVRVERADGRESVIDGMDDGPGRSAGTIVDLGTGGTDRLGG